MKKFFKILGILILIVMLAIGGFFAYVYFSKAGDKKIFSAIPPDAVYIIETSNLTEGWEHLSKNNIWKNLRKNEYFGFIDSSAATLDSLIQGNDVIKKVFENRQLAISAHMTDTNNYDFLFVIDIEKGAKVSFIKDWIGGLLSYFDYTMSKSAYKEYELLVLTNKIDKEKIYLSFADNLLLCSFQEKIIKKSIDQMALPLWIEKPSFQKTYLQLKRGSLFNIYFNYVMLPSFMKCYLSESSEMLNALGLQLTFSSLLLNINDNDFEIEGFTGINDSLSSYFSALAKVKPGKMGAYAITSDKTALFLSMCFDKFMNFYDVLLKEFARQDTANAESIDKNIKRVEKFLNVDLKEDFFSWIGNEISFVKLRPMSTKSGENDVLILFHAPDPDKAAAGLEHLTKQIRKRTPLKFKTAYHKEYAINYLDIKGFFKMFLGKLFGSVDKPYYTIIDNYVVFSNSPSTLIKFIDDFKDGKTITQNQAMYRMIGDFDKNTTVSAFINMPKMYSHLYLFSNKETQKDIQRNKELILSFSTIGFQIVAKDEQFKTRIKVSFNEDAFKDAEVEKFESAPDELSYSFFEPNSIHWLINKFSNLPDGMNELKDDSGFVLAKGSVNNSLPVGEWLFYYENQLPKCKLLFENGKIVDKIVYFYDTKESLILFQGAIKDEKLDGNYIEYYDNGKKKAEVEFKDGQLHGDAVFYYPTGRVMAQGAFKYSVKDGKWRCYTELGTLFEKEKWKAGSERKKSKKN